MLGGPGGAGPELVIHAGRVISLPLPRPAILTEGEAEQNNLMLSGDRRCPIIKSCAGRVYADVAECMLYWKIEQQYEDSHGGRMRFAGL